MKAKRKLLGVLTALVLSVGVSVSVYAWAKITTSCGKEAVTVERNAFKKTIAQHLRVSTHIFPTRYSEHLGQVECLIYLPFLPL